MALYSNNNTGASNISMLELETLYTDNGEPETTAVFYLDPEVSAENITEIETQLKTITGHTTLIQKTVDIRTVKGGTIPTPVLITHGAGAESELFSNLLRDSSGMLEGFTKQSSWLKPPKIDKMQIRGGLGILAQMMIKWSGDRKGNDVQASNALISALANSIVTYYGGQRQNDEPVFRELQNGTDQYLSIEEDINDPIKRFWQPDFDPQRLMKEYSLAASDIIKMPRAATSAAAAPFKERTLWNKVTNTISESFSFSAKVSTNLNVKENEFLKWENSKHYTETEEGKTRWENANISSQKPTATGIWWKDAFTNIAHTFRSMVDVSPWIAMSKEIGWWHTFRLQSTKLAGLQEMVSFVMKFAGGIRAPIAERDENGRYVKDTDGGFVHQHDAEGNLIERTDWQQMSGSLMLIFGRLLQYSSPPNKTILDVDSLADYNAYRYAACCSDGPVDREAYIYHAAADIKDKLHKYYAIEDTPLTAIADKIRSYIERYQKSPERIGEKYMKICTGQMATLLNPQYDSTPEMGDILLQAARSLQYGITLLGEHGHEQRVQELATSIGQLIEYYPDYGTRITALDQKIPSPALAPLKAIAGVAYHADISRISQILDTLTKALQEQGAGVSQATLLAPDVTLASLGIQQLLRNKAADGVMVDHAAAQHYAVETTL